VIYIPLAVLNPTDSHWLRPESRSLGISWEPER
jgi:hypothetical protein